MVEAFGNSSSSSWLDPRREQHAPRALSRPLVHKIFYLIPLQSRFAARVVCLELRSLLDAHAASIIGILQPSMPSKKVLNAKMRGPIDPANVALRTVLELQAFTHPIMCMCFGRERECKSYISFAVASQSGMVAVYRCYRNEEEIEMISKTDSTLADDQNAISPRTRADLGYASMTLHVRLNGHTSAITAMEFAVSDTQLLTASVDKSLRFWDAQTGQMLKVFTDASSIVCAACLPLHPDRFVVGNGHGLFRSISNLTGLVLQKFKMQKIIRTCTFDDLGLSLFLGMDDGHIRVLRVSDGMLNPLSEKRVSFHAVACINFVPATNGSEACLLVNTADGAVKHVDCIYNLSRLTRLVEQPHSLQMPYTGPPIKSCYSPSGGGYLVSTCGDHDVHICSLSGADDYRIQRLKHHDAHVLAVAVNLQHTLLASADAHGRLVLWRRMHVAQHPAA